MLEQQTTHFPCLALHQSFNRFGLLRLQMTFLHSKFQPKFLRIKDLPIYSSQKFHQDIAQTHGS
jgi:hypothetical protein